jgi:DNA-binding LytR/AlgR family response regulator
MRIKTIIVDDEDLAADLIESILITNNEIEIIGKYNSSLEALDAINKFKPHLIITDIKMPKLSGIDLVKQLAYKPLIIFTTAFSNHAIEAFNLNVLDYVVKPIAIERFNLAINKAIEQFKLQQYSNLISRNEKLITLKKNGIEHNINYNDITHIEGLKQYAIIYTQTSKFYLNETLKKLEEDFKAFDFKRVHKSFIVNTLKITKRTAISVNVNSTIIPIGRSFKDVLKTNTK